MAVRGHIRKRPSGIWYVVLPVTGRDGTRKPRWFRAGPTEEQAERLRARLLHELAEGTYLDASRVPLGEFFEEWLTHLRTRGRRERTIRIYRREITTHLAPALGRTPIGKLSARQIEAYYTRALLDGRKDGKGGLSPTTVRLHHAILRGALRQAVKWGMLARSPLEGAEPPPPGPRKGKALGAPDLLRLVEAAGGSWLEIPVLLAAFGGLRRGEVLGLKWEQIDFPGGAVRVLEAKTEAGVRTVALPAFVMDRLRAEQRRQARIAGPLVGRSPSALTEGFRRFAASAGFGRLRFHDLRHSAATTLILAGHPIKAVSARLGHAATSTTLEIYSHALPEHDRALAEWLEKEFG